MLPLLVVLTLQAAPGSPPVGVVVSRRTAVSDFKISAVLEWTYEALEREGLNVTQTPEETQGELAKLGLGDSSNCRAERACVANLGKKLKLGVIVGVDVGQLGQKLVIGLEAVSVENGRRLVQRTLLLSAHAKADEVATALQPFAKALSGLVKVAEPPTEVAQTHPETQTNGQAGKTSKGARTGPHPLTGASGGEGTHETGPLATHPPQLAPQNVPNSGPSNPVVSEHPSHLTGYLLAGGAALSGGAAIAFTLAGIHDSSQIKNAISNQNGLQYSALTYDNATQLASSANRNATLGLVTALTSVALTSAAVYFWNRGS